MSLIKRQSLYQKLLASYQEQDQRQLRKDIATILETPEGRRLLVHFQEFTQLYAPLGLEHLEYQAGRRNVGAEIMGMCNETSRENVLKAQAERNALISERNIALKEAALKDKS